MAFARLVLVAAFLSLTLVPSAQAFVFYCVAGGAATGDHQRAFNELIKAFKGAHPEATVEYDVSTSYIQPITETLMQGFGNRTPDLAVIGQVEWPILHKKGLLRRLDTVLSKAEHSAVTNALLPESKVQRYGKGVPGLEYVLPFNRGTPALYLNTRLLPELSGARTLSWLELEKVLTAARVARPASASALKIEIPGDDWISEAVLLGGDGTSTYQGRETHFFTPTNKLMLAELRRMFDEKLLSTPGTQRDAYDDFLAGKAALVMISTSAYNSVRGKMGLQFEVLHPPRFRVQAINTGGGDLAMPANPRKELDAATRRDIRSFILWFYRGEGAAIWAREASMFALTRSAQNDSRFRQWLGKRDGESRVFLNSDRWAIKSFYELEDFCHILKVRQMASHAFVDALAGDNLELVLRQADEFAGKVLATEACP